MDHFIEAVPAAPQAAHHIAREDIRILAHVAQYVLPGHATQAAAARYVQDELGVCLICASQRSSLLTSNLIGIPNEPIAVSNNAAGKFGPPKFEDVVFTLGAEPVIQRIFMGEK